MKATGIILLLLVWQSSFSQFTDSFDDGDFNINPPWSGSTADFSVIDGELQLSAPATTSSSFLVTPSASIDEASWQFTTKLSFNPSSSNYAEIYLATDSPDLSGAVNGYLVRIGWTTDNVSLIRQDGEDSEVLIEGNTKRLDQSSVEVMVRVTRSASGDWLLQTRLSSDFAWVTEGSAFDTTYSQAAYFGIKCIYTATRSDKFSFDNLIVSGNPFVDRQPPRIDSVYSISENKLIIEFSEPITEALPQNFLLNGEIPTTAVLIENVVELKFSKSHPIDNILMITDLEDWSGNKLVMESYEFVHYSFTPVLFGDVVFNEILADPSPAVDLPAVEYIEIVNSSNRAIKMTEWSYSDKSMAVLLPEIKLKPDSVIILAPTAEGWLLDNLTILSRWPSLNNAGDELWLRDSTGAVIDYLSYSQAMHDDPGKADGGWSLERRDPYLPCSGNVNWRSSIDPQGGTPGQWNSVFERITDTTAPTLEFAYALSEDSVLLKFNEPLSELPQEVSIHPLEVIGISFGETRNQLILKTAAMQNGIRYTVQISRVADCSGNVSDQILTDLFLSEEAFLGDLIINEILFNPVGDRHDYLEVYNTSAKYISLTGLTVSNGESIKTLDSYLTLKPGGYLALSPNPEEILSHYPQAKMENLSYQELPAFPNETGLVVLANAAGLTVDSVLYNESWHFAYLNNLEGISLERISPYRGATGSANWASASAQNNYGTPGYVNSQAISTNAQNKLSIEPRVMVPDADGRDDFVTISLIEAENALLTLRIYNLQGVELRMLANNELISGPAYFTWDGTDQQGHIVPLGHYVIVAELIFAAARTVTYREKVVVGTGY